MKRILPRGQTQIPEAPTEIVQIDIPNRADYAFEYASLGNRGVKGQYRRLSRPRFQRRRDMIGRDKSY